MLWLNLQKVLEHAKSVIILQNIHHNSDNTLQSLCRTSMAPQWVIHHLLCSLDSLCSISAPDSKYLLHYINNKSHISTLDQCDHWKIDRKITRLQSTHYSDFLLGLWFFFGFSTGRVCYSGYYQIAHNYIIRLQSCHQVNWIFMTYLLIIPFKIRASQWHINLPAQSMNI